MAIKAKIWWDDTAQSYVLSSSYNEKFIEALKHLIPGGDRQYDPSSKFWYVKEHYGDFVRKLAETTFGVGSISFTSKLVAQQQRASSASYGGYAKHGAQGALLNSSNGTTEDAIVAFFNLIPYDAAKRAYLLTAQQLHPDKPNGDGSKMIKLNELWDRIEKEFFKR